MEGGGGGVEVKRRLECCHVLCGGIQRVWGWDGRGPIGQIRAGFGEGTEIRWALGPPHGKAEWDANKTFPRVVRWKDDGQFQCRMRCQGDPVIAVGQVYFCH
jgi:hypothetical protein